ncbi:MAG: PHP domain-containing protein [Angelakisella sp.]
MPDYTYDLHIHSCLSPCGDEQMTPPNIANMAYIKGLQIIAVTDHNSCRNVRAVTEAAAGLPITVIPGMELCTAEEIHMVCLFPTVEAAEAAGAAAEAALPPITNRPEIFGNQEIRDSEEILIGTVDKLLINATSISIDDASTFVARYGGICYPAHIDKAANSILATFGYLPDHLGFTAVEVARPVAFFATKQGMEIQQKYCIITDSDAHQLENISEAERTLTLNTPDFAGLKNFILR